MSYSLAKSCKSDLKKYRCNVENLPRSREARLSYLLMCLESAVHRGKWRQIKGPVTCWDLGFKSFSWTFELWLRDKFPLRSAFIPGVLSIRINLGH